MVAPARFTSGFTQDNVWQPFGQVGVPNPMFYHQTWDDFDFYDTNEWTTLATSTGTVALTAGDGGLITATTAATTNDVEGIQRKVAGFTFSPPNGSTVAGKKLLFLTRISLANINSSIIVGVMNAAANPFTSFTDGLIVYKASGSSVFQLQNAVSSSQTSVSFPASASTWFANGVTFDVGFLYNPSSGTGTAGGSIVGFLGQNLVGYAPQSGSGSLNLSGTPPRQPVVSFVQINGSNPTVTTVNMAPVVAIEANASAAQTMVVDFVYCAKER